MARLDVPTCRLDERIGDVRRRVREMNWNTCFVVAKGRILLGRLHEKELTSPDEVRAGDVMQAGPSTFRPNVTVHEMLAYMHEHSLTTAPVTTGEGVLIGLALIEDLEAAAHTDVASERTSSRPCESER